MRKISEISESLWGKTLMRDIDGTERKEDDVNNMDMESFYEYIKRTYVVNDDIFSQIPDSNIEYGERFHIPLFYHRLRFFRMCVWYDNDDIRKVTIMADHKDSKEFIDELRKHYPIVTVQTTGILRIPESVKLTNKDIINIIDIVLQNTSEPIYKKVVNESLWGKTLMRDIDGTERKEDDYINLGKDDFADYLMSRYQIVWDNVMRKSNEVIYNRKYGHSIGITYAMLYLENAFIGVEYEKDDKTIRRVSMNAKGPDKEFSEMFREIRSKYKVARKTDGSGTIYIDNRDGSPVTNKTILELIDLVIGFVGDKCTLRKK